MNYSFHPAAEVEFLESVGYYESKVPGLGGALIEEFEILAIAHDRRRPQYWLGRL
ncbi:hypothetical protein EV698_1498 [Spiribacter vilamensis]|uniref:Uncharacterized protein n=1 Tax=Spiribacter vilamensis TaxID=531306 RepID=A0A4Q8D1H4_9GAMM|nr:hypothetical protein EV698_1498 [Spiribacter vilamensis]